MTQPISAIASLTRMDVHMNLIPLITRIVRLKLAADPAAISGIREGQMMMSPESKPFSHN
jgi:hypothetical protein